MVTAETQAGWMHLEAGRWSAARDAFEAAARTDESPRVLHGLADALWWAGDVSASVPYHQRAFTAYREAGDTISAAMVALALAMTYKCCFGNDAAASGWLSRAESVAGEGDPAPLKGYLTSMRGHLLIDTDLDAAEKLNWEALDYARRTGDRDLELMCISEAGEILVRRGDADQGIRYIDEAMAGLDAGEYRHTLTFIIVCCAMLVACDFLADIRRASNWFVVGERFLNEVSSQYLFSECRATYGSMLFAIGKWTRAERELLSAIAATGESYPAINTVARARLARLHLCRGNIEAAEGLLAGIEQETPALPALAAVKLARGEPTTATSLLDRYLRNVDRQTISTAYALQLRVEAQLALTEVDAATGTLAELRAMEARRAWPEVSARASMAAGSIARAQDDSRAALAHFERAMGCFSSLGMVYESARARFAAAAILAESNQELAAIEANGTLTVFEKLGARPDADAAAALLRKLGVASKPGPRTGALLSRREEEVLQLLSQGLSNPEIADRLVISRKTAAHHVSSLLSKLGLRNRAEAVAYAARAGAGVVGVTSA